MGCSNSTESVPDDIAFNIASFLNVRELCLLGSCSRHLRCLCASDVIWVSVYNRRWLSPSSPPAQGWKQLYMGRHEDIANTVSAVKSFVEQCSQNDSLEVGNYLKAVADLGAADLGFEDVKDHLFTMKNNVLLNLIGLHYSMFTLRISAKDVNETLCRYQISTREICVSSFRLGRWFFGFRLPDERFSRKVSLGELTSPGEEQLFYILRRGAVHEVLRVQITPASSRASTAVLAQPPAQLRING